ncbi:MAG: family 78 glycoside hydrolase catalytic domain [Lachnospiraceae bacterium]|nr:family 78 glycoside hydrolase catalytic domain [Lachnospiraceae bacterium]
MKICHLKLNHLVNPLGYDLKHPTVSYLVEDTKGKKQKKAQVLVSLNEDFSSLLYDSGESEEIVNTGFELPVCLEPETRYYWKVRVWADNGETAESPVAWFETPKAGEWKADWITPEAPKEQQVSLIKKFTIQKPVKSARMYLVGLGVYELYLNGKKQGEECLLPGFCDYDTWIPYQTFELDLPCGENEIQVLLGDGWYKGWFGLRKTRENYGDRLACIGELHIRYGDGTSQIVATDLTWKARKSKVVLSGIYPGEVYDSTLDTSKLLPVKGIDLDKQKLAPRLNPPITIHERITPTELIHTPAGEQVLDMGQNMVGWLEFYCTAPRGTVLRFQFGEILQDGNFYNGNLRTAKAEFIYTADGTNCYVRQHFTFYGYRYVKVMGWKGDLRLEDFQGLVIHSEMEEIGFIETANPMVNQLIHNVKWGQKGNFLDIPTDCPQRDERCGWTGDAQVFSGTACFNMDTYAFYTKYGKDVYGEQKKRRGSVPNVVPAANYPGDGSTAWGEAATIIPWNVYLHYGDKGILVRQYDSMKAWVDYMKGEDDREGGRRLWQSGAHFGDWLALDGNVAGGVYGATDPFLISSAYYYYSTCIVARAAEVLKKEEDVVYYKQLAQKIREAFIQEYFTPAGRLCIDTMTAYVVVLYMGLTPDFAYENTCKGLLNRLKKNRYHLDTGFVGTPYLCRVLSEHGMNELAYHLLLEEGYPGWLYEVRMGATTVWERWNSVLPDGRISGTEMNSLNHYAYGSILEWMYRNMLGLSPLEEAPGFKKFKVAVLPNYQIPWAKAELLSAAGRISSGWKIEKGKLEVEVRVPFDAEAVILLPDAEVLEIQRMTAEWTGILGVSQVGNHVEVKAEAGAYAFCYQPTRPYRKIYSVDSPVEELLENEKTRKILEEEYFSRFIKISFRKELYTLAELLNGPFSYLPYEEQRALDQKLRSVE